MKLARHEIKSDELKTTYEFLSEGAKGKIKKIIQFSLVNDETCITLLSETRTMKQARQTIELSLTTETVKKCLQP